MKNIGKLCNKLIDYRYVIFLILFILCVFFKLHGSSIGQYNNYIYDKLDKNAKEEIIGASRAIRSDEYMVHTPYYFSQYYNNYKKYSKQMSYSGQNMILGYNAPVKDITTIGKPFTWGYLLFGNEYGLSWYWCSKLFLFILVCFELIMILTKGNRFISAIGGLLISFAPTMQWWFVPHITDVFFWAIAVTVVCYHFFVANKTWKKVLFTILLPCCAIGYCLALFPSCQLPLAIFSLALIIAFLVRDKKSITFNKKEWYRILFVLFLFLSVMSYFLITSINDLKLLLHTVYPGSRVSVGNDSVFVDMFTDLTTIFLPYKTINYSNNCEASTFIHLAPFFLMIYPIIIKIIKKKKDKDSYVGQVLFYAIIIELFFMLIGFPKIVSKLTLFSYINRMELIYGYTSVVFTIWCIYVIQKYNILLEKKVILISTSVFLICYLTSIDTLKVEYVAMRYYILEVLYFTLICYLILKGNKTIPLYMLLFLIAIASFTINPISHGISAITNHKSYKFISSRAQKDNGIWLINGSSIYSNYVLSAGARTVSATNFYPDYKKWKLIDPDKKNDDYYNRYANMTFNLTNDNTSFELIALDNIKVNLNYNDLEKLKIKYVFSLDELEDEFNSNNISNKRIYNDGQIIIYEIV